jgi:hypothetical protein
MKPSPISHTGDGFCYPQWPPHRSPARPRWFAQTGQATNFSFIAPTPDGAALMIMESAESPWTYFQIRVLSVDRNARVPPSIVFESEFCRSANQHATIHRSLARLMAVSWCLRVLSARSYAIIPATHRCFRGERRPRHFNNSSHQKFRKS